MQKRPFFSHHRLGYRRNPFGALTRAEWMAVAVLPPVVGRAVAQAPAVLQLLGTKGAGKTTTLLELAQQFAADNRRVAYEHLAEGETRLKTPLAEPEVFLLDEAQRLSWWQRQRLGWGVARQMGKSDRFRLVLSSHEDLTRLFGRYRLAITTVRLTHAISRDHWQRVLTARLDYFALPDRSRLTLADEAIDYLYQTFRDDLREAEYFLYDVWQQATAPGMITAEQLRRVRRLKSPL